MYSNLPPFGGKHYSGTSINGHLYATDTSEQRTNIFVPKYTMAKGDISIQRTPLYNGRKIGPTGVRYMEVPLYLFSFAGIEFHFFSSFCKFMLIEHPLSLNKRGVFTYHLICLRNPLILHLNSCFHHLWFVSRRPYFHFPLNHLDLSVLAEEQLLICLVLPAQMKRRLNGKSEARKINSRK